MAGNKNSGRHRTTTPEDPELEELGQEMVAWATEKTREFRAHIKQWYSLEKGFTKKQFDLMIEKPIFQEYYEKAMAAIAIRYLDGTVNQSIAQRFLRLYFPDLREEENDLLKLKAEIGKKKEEETQDDLARKLVEAIKDSEKLSGAEEAGRSEVEIN